jgi:ABC-type glycerol-3-phosphate transport system substrate-binding protein
MMACLCVLLLSSGCASLAAPTPEPVTISFAHPSVNTGYYEELLPIFGEQYPHITVNLLPMQTQGDFARIEERGTDVIELYPGGLHSAYQGDVLLALNSVIEQDLEFDLADFYPSGLELATVEGEIWGIPSGIECGVMVYNKDLFDQHGVPYPQNGWTWDDFVEVGQALTDPQTGTYGFAPQRLDPMYYEWVPYLIDPLYFVYQHGGRVFDDWKNPTRTTYDDPLTVEAVEWYAKLIHERGVAPPLLKARKAFSGDSRGWVGFTYGKAGMMIAGPSDRFPGPGGKAVRRGVVALPRGQQTATFCVASVHSIWAETEHLEASWEWVDFLSRQAPPRWMPARRSTAESELYEKRVGAENASAARAAIASTLVLPFYLQEERLEAIEAFHEAVLEVCDEESIAQEALSEAQQASRFGK